VAYRSFLEEVVEDTLLKLADDTRLGGIGWYDEGRAAVQRDLEGLEEWDGGEMVKFSRYGCKALQRDWLVGSSSAEGPRGCGGQRAGQEPAARLAAGDPTSSRAVPTGTRPEIEGRDCPPLLSDP